MIDKAAEIIASSSSLLVLTGAGISAESGVPTFRGKGGLWKSFSVEDLATPEGFARNPKVVWEWYSWRRGLVRSVEPNPGHFAVAELENLFDDFLLATQNVDRLHHRAGSRKVVELHGNIFGERCTRCDFRRESYDSYDEPPTCPSCGALLRPDVVWFGEPLPEDALHAAISFAQKAECALVVGTSAVVYPAAELPYIVKNGGGRVVEVNLEPTPVTRIADVSVFGKSGTTMPQIVEGVKRILGK